MESLQEMNTYHKLTPNDYLTVATKCEINRFKYISDITLCKTLATLWCAKHGYKLGGYIGGWSWDSTKI